MRTSTIPVLLSLSLAACGRPGGTGSVTVDPVAEDSAALDGPSLQPQPVEELSERLAVVREESPTAANERMVDVAQVFGRAVDETGVPIPNAKVHMGSVGEPWAPGASADEFVTSTDAQGQFLLTVPVPTSSWVHVLIVPSEFHALGGRDFGPAGGRSRDPLRAGANDLGDLVLPRCGAIFGVVTDAFGAPVAGAEVSVVERLPGELRPNARTDENGTFVLGHLPAMLVSVDVEAKGHLQGRSDSVQVVLGERAGPVHIELQLAPVVSGKIEDEDGNPVAGAQIRGWPEQSGRRADAESAADGSFVVQLPHSVAYRFSVSAEGYIPIGEGGGDPEVVLEPDSKGVVLALRKSPRWAFVVLDDLSGEPVESFGLRVRPKPDGTWLSGIDQMDIPVGSHVGGRVVVDADPSKHLIQIQAPGYAPQSVEFGASAVRNGEQELRLVRGSVVSAAVRLEGVLVDQPTAKLAPALIKFDPSLPDEKDPLFSDNYGTDLDRFKGRPRMVRGDRQGRLQIEDLAAGTYTLTITAKGAAPWVTSPLRLEPSAMVDLGAIDLRPGATIRGRILPEQGRMVAGTTVYLDEPFDEITVVVKDDGAFEFTDLASGEHTLVVERTPGVQASRFEVQVTVAVGETVVQNIDLAQ